MGYTPIPRIPPRSRTTRIERLKDLYVASRIDVETLEWYAGLLFENRVADEPYVPAPPEPGGLPPPERADAARSARPSHFPRPTMQEIGRSR